MNTEQFKAKLAKLDDDDIEELDTLCLKQLMESSKDYGEQGQDAKDLLKIVARKLEIFL